MAVQSQAFNTGAAVPWARPGVGAVATQSFTDRRYGWRGLELLEAGASPADVLDRLRAADEHAEGDQSLAQLRRLLERALGYRAASRATVDREQIGLRHGLPDIHVRQLAIEDALDSGDIARAKSLFAAVAREQPRWRDAMKTRSDVQRGR